MKTLLQAVLTVLALTTSSQLAAMQVHDSHSAAVFIQQQRPTLQACLSVAQRNNSLANIWTSAPCEKLRLQDGQIRKAWSLLLPDGSVSRLSVLPYKLRQLTVESYAEYKTFAERIAQLNN